MACKHFQLEIHNFNKHVEFTIIDELINTSKSKKTLTQCCIQEFFVGFSTSIVRRKTIGESGRAL